MKIKQLSIFMENRVGMLNEVTAILGDAGINMRAYTVAEGIDFGILRLIVPDADYAQGVMESAGYKVIQTDVLCVEVANRPGSLAKLLARLAEEGVFIQYMYAFSDNDMASVVIRPNDIDKCVGLLSE